MGNIYKYMKKIMRRDFPKYKRIQVAATLTEVEILCDKSIKHIPLEKYTVAYIQELFKRTNRHQIYVGVDQLNKIVYWNYKKLDDDKDEWEYV